MIRGLAIVAAFYALGALVERASGLPLPGAVVGLVLFVVALRFGVVRRAWVEEACTFLTGRMALFLVPASVLVVGSGSSVAQALVPIVVASVASALLVLVVVAKIAERLAPPAREDEPR